MGLSAGSAACFSFLRKSARSATRIRMGKVFGSSLESHRACTILRTKVLLPAPASPTTTRRC